VNINQNVPMKTLIRIVLALLSAAFVVSAQAASVSLSDSIVSLATNGTKYYTFLDPVSGHFVEVALTMKAHSSDPAAVLQSLDGGTRVGVGNPAVAGDGNNISVGEGVDFTASASTISAGVVSGSISFNITGLGLRDTGGGAPYWRSSGSSSNAIALSTEGLYALDGSVAGLLTGYIGQLRTITNSGTYQLSDVGTPGGQGLTLNVTFSTGPAGDPRTNSWFTTYSSKYARIYTNNTMKAAGTSLTTWNNGTQNQSAPAYAGVQAVYSSSNWLYLRSSGLAQHIMGPWQNGAFPNLPKNQNVLYRIPRMPAVPGSKTLTGLGAIGYFVDGVAMLDSRDGFVWTGSAESGNGTGYWNRDAYVNEGATFDAGYAHQEQTGTHHYHASPIALRYLVGDHVDYNPSTKNYSESTNPVVKHSPILGWVRDGFPVYGPFGYSVASNATSAVRRMISGFVLRNGQSGTQDLTVTGRTNIPAWAVRMYGVSASQSGPAVSSTYPLDRYMEDKDYLGDVVNPATGSNYVQGVDFDLDEYNGRWCVTPEFPNGTYAYFVSIKADGTPAFPYNIGRAFYGNPTGSTATLTESVATNFLGGANIHEVMNSPARSGNNVVLTWSAMEGGTYRVEAESDLSGSNWQSIATNTVSGTVIGSATETNGASNSMRFYRVARTALAAYDGSSGGTGGTTFAVPGGSVSRGTGTNITLAITLGTIPPQPPANAPISSVTMGSLTASSTSYTVQGTVMANFTIPSNASLGPQTVVVTFSPPQGQTTGPTYTFTNGFTINP
jgi:YHYH protein